MFHYHPFGWEISDRSFSADMYRFGFNGKENDSDFGNQLIQDYGFRLYNPAIAKFLSTDPLSPSYPELTPYQFASNTPIAAIDVDGLEGVTNTQVSRAVAEQKQAKTTTATAAKVTTATSSPGLTDGVIHGVRGKVDGIHRFVTRDMFMGSTWKGVQNTIVMTSILGGSNIVYGQVKEFNDKVVNGTSFDRGEYIGGVAFDVITGKGLQKAGKIFKADAPYASILAKNKICGCFVAGTIIKTEEGDKNIEDVKEGDYVWAFDNSTKTIALKEVTGLIRVKYDEIYNIHITNGDTIQTTHEHPFYVRGIFIRADELNVGDTLLTLDSSITIILSITKKYQSHQVYNFTVDDYHTYFVGSNGILVHNTGPCNFLNKALKRQNFQTGDAYPNGFKEKFTENGYDYEVRIHGPDPNASGGSNSATNHIYRVSRKQTPVEGVQGSGVEYMDNAGNWLQH
ncbi:MAG: polymorphic toxin-type HINT domain-containing protein [Aureispira sp.]